jgi:hypothetical protein
MKNANLALAAMLALFASPTAAESEVGERPDFFAAMLESVELGEPMQSGPLVLVPLLVDKPPRIPQVDPGLGVEELAFGEAAWPRRRFNVEVFNKSERPMLVLGGTILIGGRLDRMIPRDVLVPPRETLELRALPAEYQRRYRSNPPPLHCHATLAPTYLRERAFENPYRNLVPDFVSHFLEFRPEGDERLSLAAIDESPRLAEFCVSCQAGLREFPDIGGLRVVGFFTAVRGHIKSVELFGHNTLLKAHFEPLIRAHTYAAAALELRANRVGLPLPDTAKDALARTTAEANEILERLKTKLRVREDSVPEGSVGQALLARSGDLHGYAVGHEGQLVHAVLFTHDPLERRLYARPLNPPDPVDDSEEDPEIGELERRGASGRRLTEYEKRLLERVRRR